MEKSMYCQSCGMPLDNTEMLGTEKDGSKNQEYCKYCYGDGKFINPGISLEEMQSLVAGIMEEQNIPEYKIETAVKSLPELKRWKTSPVPVS